MKTTQTVPQSERTAIRAELYMSFELADKTWKLTISDGRCGLHHARQRGAGRLVGCAQAVGDVDQRP